MSVGGYDMLGRVKLLRYKQNYVVYNCDLEKKLNYRLAQGKYDILNRKAYRFYL